MANRPTVDGFIPRRSSGQLGEHHFANRKPVAAPAAPTGLQRRQAVTSNPEGRQIPAPKRPATTGLTQTDHGLSRHTPVILSRSDVDESLREIDEQEHQQQAARPRHKRRIAVPHRRKLIKRIVILMVLILLGIGIWLGVKFVLASQSVFKGDMFGLIQHRDLKMDANGRSNVLIIGTSEDDPGHDASWLTDSIMVMSIDQKNKNAYMFSIPRDLYVKYGMACLSGYAGKINSYFDCVNNDYKSEAAETERQDKMRELVGGLFGMDIQYAVHVNYSVMRDTVNALGTITVNIEGSGGAPGVMDSNFDWKCKGGNPHASLATMKKNCPPNGHFIEYPNGPAVLDAEHALYLAQARGDISPTYGLGRSNFDRELNQQKIIKAIREKAMSTGTLTNPGKVSGLIDALGNNLRTNFETPEIRTLISLAQDIPSDQIHSISLIDAEPALFGGDGNNNVIPTAGTYDYSDIQAYLKKKMNSSPVAKEAAHVIVLNGSGVAGAAQVEADKLTALGMEVDQVANAPSGTHTTNVIYKITKKDSTKPKTAEKLTTMYGATPVTTAPPIDVPASTDFVVIVVSASTVQAPTGGGQSQ